MVRPIFRSHANTAPSRGSDENPAAVPERVTVSSGEGTLENRVFLQYSQQVARRSRRDGAVGERSL